MNFYVKKIAKGSVGEVRSQLYVAREIKYITESQFLPLHQEMETLGKNVGGLIVYLEKYRRNLTK